MHNQKYERQRRGEYFRAGKSGQQIQGNGFVARILTHNNGKNKNNYVQNKDFTKYTFHMDGFVG